MSRDASLEYCYRWELHNMQAVAAVQDVAAMK